MSSTVVFFHAHPDDEVLYTGGTMARLAANGHRVILVTATAGEAGLTSSKIRSGGSLAELRRVELVKSAAILGCTRVIGFGYADSGLTGDLEGVEEVFCRMAVEPIAARLARLLVEERADVVTMYDPAGGYGHPDHRQVFRVGARAAQLAATPVGLEATIDRRALQRALQLVRWAKRASPEYHPARFDHLYTPPWLITHRVDVSAYLDQKHAAMEAHVSQAAGDEGTRALAGFLRLPSSLFRLAFGREWFVEHGRVPTRPPLDDVLASLHPGPRGDGG